MVDFNKKLGSIKTEKLLNPVEIYDSLDRASDKGPLRPAQESILLEWFTNFKNNKDVVIKLHTGQGKTLVGLLLLQSKINENLGPALFICPNNFLIQQTLEQARQFGIKALVMENDIPLDFSDGKIILITSVQKLFNGLTKFGLNNKSVPVNSIVIDDAHACMDSIKNNFSIIINNSENAYIEILQMFHNELEFQGAGTFSDIQNQEFDAFQLIPYWAWIDRSSEIVKILAKYNDSDSIRFKWPLIKNRIKYCRCLISGTHLEITPYLFPIESFGSFYSAAHRVFMSATVNDDSFFIKGLGVDPNAIKNPLIYTKERWSGEKMILLPELIDSRLNRNTIISYFGRPFPDRKFGTVGLTPSFRKSEDWKKYGALIASRENIQELINLLKAEKYNNTVVFANRYDGIDLPDNMCRQLIIDSKPFSQSLFDRYQEYCRENSEILAVQISQRVEQGLGRGVRGEKDYCTIILIGSDLIKAIKSRETTKYFSSQTRTQIDIGFSIAEYAKEDIVAGKDPIEILVELLNQCINRNEGWKRFYSENMNSMVEEPRQTNIIEILEMELAAEIANYQGHYDLAILKLQHLIDSKLINTDSEKGWYLQELARYNHSLNKAKYNEIQIAAHRLNNYLLRPENGMIFNKINLIEQGRVANIIKYVRKYNFENLMLEINDILNSLSFGSNSEKFEHALNNIAFALGFIGQRPDKQMKEGPDNIWTVNYNEYILFECKNEVKATRNTITKEETKQMNNSIAWFEQKYGSVEVKCILIIPTTSLGKGAALPEKVEIMTGKELASFKSHIRAFFNGFREYDLQTIGEEKIQQQITIHKLSVAEIRSLYSKKWVDK